MTLSAQMNCGTHSCWFFTGYDIISEMMWNADVNKKTKVNSQLCCVWDWECTEP